jgi:branched-chain amino acid transport system permease protein
MLVVLNGLSLAAVLFLIGSGLSLVMGAMGVVNLAHGALYMIGAYVGWSVAIDAQANFVLAVLAGAAAAGLLGLLMHWAFFKRLLNRIDEQILVSFGLIYILQSAVKSVWGPVGKPPFSVPALSGSFTVGGFSYPMVRLVVIGIGVLAVVGLWMLQEHTRMGAIVRAGMDDRGMVEAMGVNVKLVAAVLFAVGAAMAGGAGVIGGLIKGAEPSFGVQIMLLALIVVVLGGVGSTFGAVIGAVVAGLTTSVSVVAFPAVSSFALYLVMVLVLLFRPAGISGRSVRT